MAASDAWSALVRILQLVLEGFREYRRRSRVGAVRSDGGSAWLRKFGALTSVPPAPMTPGTIITEAWAYEENGRWEQVEGEWIHLPANEGAELLLWIEHAEELCR